MSIHAEPFDGLVGGLVRGIGPQPGAVPGDAPGLLAKLHDAGFRGASLINAYNAVIGAMVGFTTQEFAMLPPDAESLREDLAGFPDRIDANRHPLLAQLSGQMIGAAFILRWQNGATQPMTGAFAMYVEAFVTGLDRLPRDGGADSS